MLHVVDLTIFLVYLGIASHYALNPVKSDTLGARNVPDPRALFLLIYSLSRIFNKELKRNAHFALMTLSILLSHRLTPRFNDNTYILLLLSLSIHIVQIQLPLHPSSVLLFPSNRMLPISCIFNVIITQIFLPALLFFLPVLIIVSFLLSLSLSDVFFLFASSSSAPAPENARVAFLMLGSLILALFSCLTTCMVLASPSVASTRRAILPWDAYGPKVAIQTRKAFLKAVLHYSTPFLFPPPFNLLEFLLIDIPYGAMVILKRKDLAETFRTSATLFLWTATIFPLVLLFASFWLWGFLA